MNEEILYIDDGELVYYINKNEFITCDEIPRPMLEGIKNLQQRVEQLENIRKEAIEYIQENYNELTDYLYIDKKEIVDDLLNILNKGSEE